MGIFSLLSVGSWVAFDVVRNATKTTVTKVQQAQILPLESKIDETVLNKIRMRQIYEDVMLDSVVSRPLPDDTLREKPGVEKLSTIGQLASPSATQQ